MTMNWSNKPAWYVIRPAFRHDALARDEIEAFFRGVGMDEAAAAARVFQPTYTRYTLVRHSRGRRRPIKLPLTPGYLFVKLSKAEFGKLSAVLDDPRRHERQRECRHVASFYRIGRERRPPVCNEKAVAQLIEKCAAGVFDQGKTRSGDGFLKDDQVRIVDGPLAGALARFKDGKCRPGFFRVVHERLFGKDTTVTVAADALEAA